MINELNYNASRNIDLIEDRIKQLKAAVAEADRHVELSRKELEAQKANFSYYKKIETASRPSYPSASPVSPSDGANRYLRNQVYSDISSGLQADKSYELTGQGREQVSQKQFQEEIKSQEKSPAKERPADLFEASGQIVSNAGTTFTVENDGSSYTNVPVIGGNVRYADELIHPEKNIKQIIRDLNAAGHSIDEIASEVNCSTTEVQMALSLEI
ncbi:MAG: hypothetical protein II821_05295 [Treponema sp.]|nr:hypothetical protein [Treponema sp.]